MPTNGDAADALAVLSWARENGVPVAAVTCGGCTVSLYEPRGDGTEKRDQPRRGAEGGIYGAMGGEVWKNAVRAGDIEGPGHDRDDGSDLEPAVGGRA